MAVPDSAVHPASYSVVALADAKAVDFDDGIVWFLLLGSDARDGEDVTDGRADAIELVGLDFDTGRATAVAVPRDTWIEIPGHGFGRINAALPLGGPELVADAVESLVGITPDVRLHRRLRRLRLDGRQHRPGSRSSRTSPSDPPDGPVPVRRGLNRMDGEEALAFARARVALPRSDFDRIANQHSLMKGILRALRGGEDTEGFIERGSLSALRGLDTDLSPVELYRLAQAVTTFRVSQVTTCAILGADAHRGRRATSWTSTPSSPGGWAGTSATTPGSTRGAADRGRPDARSLQPGLPGQHDGLGAVRDLELREDVARVVAHGLGGDARARARSRRSPVRRRCAPAPCVRDR